MNAPRAHCTFPIKVKPGAKSNRIAGTLADMLRVHVTAPPERGRANKAVIQTLAKALGVRKSQVTVRTGHTAAVKRISVDGLSPDEYHAFFQNLQKRTDSP